MTPAGTWLVFLHGPPALSPEGAAAAIVSRLALPGGDPR
jgi:hypothetical protein